MGHTSEYAVENMFIDRLESLGYQFVKMNSYDDVLENFRTQLAKFNEKKLAEKGHAASFSDAEFNRIMIHVDNHSVYESAKILRDKFVLELDNGESVYIEFFSADTDRNLYQVTHQVTMDKAHKDDVVYKNRYDVTVLINGLPVVQIELKRPGVEINEAINQINRYRKFSFKGLFRYLQLFVVSNSVQTKYFCNENEMVDGQYNPILKSLVFFWTDEKNVRINDLHTFTGEFFRKTALTEMLDKYMVIKSTEPILMVMRPYQIYAVKAAKKRVLEVNQNGYVFACTGSGKTLTSFKLAQLLRDEARIDLVVFLIDRKDLDDQTVDEYNSFEKDCVDNTDSTSTLIQRLKSSGEKMIVTTIQKMANAVKNPKYAPVMDAYRDKKVVFIIDECHRSQFGKMHGQIQKHFTKANYIGFTGTPIFEKNKGADGRTTADIFHAGDKLDSCLHKYMIKDAIADGNVLRFSVEYQRTIFARNLAAKGIDPEQLDDPEYCKRHGLVSRLYEKGMEAETGYRGSIFYPEAFIREPERKIGENWMWYTQQCLENGWSSTVLSHQIESGLYYRQALVDKTTNFKEQLANPFSEQAEEIIKDPYIFDFIPNAKKLKETELEDALVQQITKLLLEFGSGFAFMGRQYPIQVGKREFFIDLLFYNVKLHCYFVVELKTVEFEPEFAGKLSFYLSAVDGELKSLNDNPTIGLLLCKGKDKMVAEYALKDVNKPMGVSEYKLSNHVSEELQDKLPSIEDIEKRIN